MENEAEMQVQEVQELRVVNSDAMHTIKTYITSKVIEFATALDTENEQDKTDAFNSLTHWLDEYGNMTKANTTYTRKKLTERYRETTSAFTHLDILGIPVNSGLYGVDMQTMEVIKLNMVGGEK